MFRLCAIVAVSVLLFFIGLMSERINTYKIISSCTDVVIEKEYNLQDHYGHAIISNHFQHAEALVNSNWALCVMHKVNYEQNTFHRRSTPTN